ncbi:hypothetical protein ES319_A03G096000v1, partial [Gossypium barbadense]
MAMVSSKRKRFLSNPKTIERVPNANIDEGYRLSVDAELTSSVEQHNESKVTEVFANFDSKGRTLLLTCYIPAFLHGSARSSTPASPFPLSPFLLSKTGRMEYSQVVRHQFFVPACKGLNPFTPDYEHPIGSVKNELTTTGEVASPDKAPRWRIFLKRCP